MRPKRPEKQEEKCFCDGSGDSMYGYCNCGFSYNDCWDAHTPLIEWYEKQLDEVAKQMWKVVDRKDKEIDELVGALDNLVKANKKTDKSFYERALTLMDATDNSIKVILKHKGNK